jgi:hypothetical protein
LGQATGHAALSALPPADSTQLPDALARVRFEDGEYQRIQVLRFFFVCLLYGCGSH